MKLLIFFYSFIFIIPVNIIMTEMDEKEIEEIKNWLNNNVSIKTYSTNFYRHFYTRCHSDSNLCKIKLNNYLVLKQLYPDYLQAANMDDSRFNLFCQSVYSLYLPMLTKNNYRIYLDKITDDEELFDIVMIMKYFNMQTDLRYNNDPLDDGEIIIFDCNHINLGALIAFVPYFIKMLQLVLEAYPMKLKELILINTSTFMEITLNMLKSLLPNNYKNSLHVYSGGSDCLLQHIEIDVLPSDYGGKLPSLDKLRNDMVMKLNIANHWLQQLNTELKMMKYFDDNYISVFGPNGTFKKLQFD